MAFDVELNYELLIMKCKQSLCDVVINMKKLEEYIFQIRIEVLDSLLILCWVVKC